MAAGPGFESRLAAEAARVAAAEIGSEAADGLADVAAKSAAPDQLFVPLPWRLLG